MIYVCVLILAYRDYIDNSFPIYMYVFILVLISFNFYLIELCANKMSSVQFSSVAQSCLTLCNPMNRSMPGLPVHHRLPEFTQTHAH